VYHGSGMTARWLSLPGVVVALLAATTGAGCVQPTPVERAMALGRQHREEEGVVLLRRELAARPDDLAARRLLIRLLAVSGNLAAAREEVEALAHRLPEGDPSPSIELGHALELAHQFDEALVAYGRAGEIAPASPVGPLEAGRRTARWGEWAASRGFLEEAIRRGAAGADVWHTLGLVRLNLHDLDGAREAYRTGATADPRSFDCWVGLATVALASRDWTGGLAAYDALLRLRPTWGDGELGRAWALAKLGRPVEAARALDHAEELGAQPAAVAKQRALLTAPPSPRSPEPEGG